MLKINFNKLEISNLCEDHDIQDVILDETVRLVIYNYLKEKPERI